MVSFTISAIATTLLLATSTATASFNIVYPSASAYWVANSSNTYQWSTSGNDNPSLFSVYISNVVSGVIVTNNGAAQLGLSNNIQASTGTITIPYLPEYVIGDGFVLQFTNVYNATDVFATSQQFTVQPKGTTYAQTSNVAPGNAGQFATVTTSQSVAGVIVKTGAGSQATTVTGTSSSSVAGGAIPNASAVPSSSAATNNSNSTTTAKTSTVVTSTSTTSSQGSSASTLQVSSILAAILIVSLAIMA